MARIARVVAPGFPHHITQRGNRRQKTFFNDEDYQAYIDLISDWCSRFGVEVWAYCLMPNHVHLIAVPESEDGLRLTIGEAHRRYMSDNDDKLVKIAPLLQITGGTWEDFLNVKMREEEIIEMQRHQKTGRKPKDVNK